MNSRASTANLSGRTIPDTLIAQGVPQEFIDTANEKLAVINDAYDRIERERKAV